MRCSEYLYSIPKCFSIHHSWAVVIKMAFYKTATSAHLVLSWQHLNNLTYPFYSPVALFLFTCLPVFPSLPISEICWHCVLPSLQAKNRFSGPSLTPYFFDLPLSVPKDNLTPFLPYSSLALLVWLCLLFTEPACHHCQMDRACYRLDLQACQGQKHASAAIHPNSHPSSSCIPCFPSSPRPQLLSNPGLSTCLCNLIQIKLKFCLHALVSPLSGFLVLFHLFSCVRFGFFYT